MRRFDYVWEGGGLLRMPCLECGENFSAKRRDAKFCSANCRKAWSRRKEQIGRDLAIAYQSIESIRRVQRERPDLEDECYAALARLKTLLAVTPASVTDKNGRSET
jgi:hypothetical protein